MKYFSLLFPAMLCVNVLLAQNCDNLISMDEDKTTGDKTYSANDFITLMNNDGDTSLQLLPILINNQKSLILSLNAKKIRCVDPTDEIHFLFADNTKYNTTGNQDLNCEGAFSLYFG